MLLIFIIGKVCFVEIILLVFCSGVKSYGNLLILQNRIKKATNGRKKNVSNVEKGKTNMSIELDEQHEDRLCSDIRNNCDDLSMCARKINSRTKSFKKISMKTINSEISAYAFFPSCPFTTVII